jgi:hypothetical protein
MKLLSGSRAHKFWNVLMLHRSSSQVLRLVQTIGSEFSYPKGQRKMGATYDLGVCQSYRLTTVFPACPICLSRQKCAPTRYNCRCNLRLSSIGSSWLTLQCLVGGVSVQGQGSESDMYWGSAIKVSKRSYIPCSRIINQSQGGTHTNHIYRIETLSEDIPLT